MFALTILITTSSPKLEQYTSVLFFGLSVVLAACALGMYVLLNKSNTLDLDVTLKFGSKSLMVLSTARVSAIFGAIRGSTDPSIN